ncbi:hypothetical protein [Rhizobium sp. P44RR-XXIV]|uniref:hypothetical protein n=1 Tax=Rhizobium sp. P44RR-XXIV TaxID=1921145 RepID=UPI000985DF27|nr:hypothetical protein [Rhizobium sp. P44RR-XXIV]TIX91966.1 hypothetical protein BSK43_006055 [Rhizobium sp. P44RR-XXIV]
MMESFALAKALEIESRAREEQWRRNEDLFYRDNARDPSPFAQWLGRILAALIPRRTTTKKADRLQMSRSACANDRCSDQAASCRT